MGANFPDHGFDNSKVIDDTFLRDVKSRKACCVWFDLPKLFGAEQPEPLQSVRDPPFMKSMEARNLFLLRRNNYLPAQLMRNIMLCAKVHHSANSLHCQTGFRRTWLVIEPAVKNAAIMASLVAAGAAFFFKEKQLQLREAFEQLVRGRQANNSATDNSNSLGHSLSNSER